jgi:hypothetical protein
MVATVTKLSVSLPTDLLLLARNAGLTGPKRPLSTLLAELVAAEVNRRDRETSSVASLAPVEDALSDAMLRAGVEAMADELSADRNDYREWKRRRPHRGKKLRAAGDPWWIE